MSKITGYLLLFLYFVVVFVIVGKIAKHLVDVSFSRKIIHILTGFSWFIYDIFFGCSIHQIIICALLLLLAIFSKFFKIIKTIEIENNSNGTIYYSVALFSLMTISYFFPEIYPIVGYSIIALAIGDGAATLVGRYIKSIKIYKDKTLFGFLGCIIFSLIGLILYNAFYGKLFNWYSIIIVSIIIGIFEEESNGFDNITVAFSSFISFTLLFYFNNINITLLLFSILFIICFFAKVMTYHGSLLSAFIGASFYHITNLNIILYIVILYLLLIIIHLYRKVNKVKELDIVKKTKSKDIIQVIANGIVSIIFLYLYLFIKDNKLLIISLITFANSFVDSIASDIGSLSKNKPYDFIHNTYVERGQSGGISFLGTFSAFLAALVFSIGIKIVTNCSFIIVIISPIIMMICCFMDTILGSILQVKYQCECCGLITEKEEHCDKLTKIYKGYRIFNNDTVNLICSVFCGLLSLVILVL